MNNWIEAHPQEVQDIVRLDEDDLPTRRVAGRILNEPDQEQDQELE